MRRLSWINICGMKEKRLGIRCPRAFFILLELSDLRLRFGMDSLEVWRGICRQTPDSSGRESRTIVSRNISIIHHWVPRFHSGSEEDLRKCLIFGCRLESSHWTLSRSLFLFNSKYQILYGVHYPGGCNNVLNFLWSMSVTTLLDTLLHLNPSLGCSCLLDRVYFTKCRSLNSTPTPGQRLRTKEIGKAWLVMDVGNLCRDCGVIRRNSSRNTMPCFIILFPKFTYCCS